ncbi:cytochrome c oxidase assembly protein [Methylococcus sp. EFPC2]|uniref:cytochrome c oxidase assembly protein n=1 Tax=Methylococcus sp. EFPC2 TaxID=2812648 RepID=UPI0019685FE6|nr:cytochrome c oxidase assembly protein [Methylococcus sp. EFPC2]QSA98766.1 cytochrome c oxidase assembly protein [Methylococcus sp. EFPC2]
MNQFDKQKANARLVRRMVLIAVAMFGFGFALVPFYDVFCDLTGLNGKVKSEASADGGYQVDANREVNLEFVTSVNGDTPLKFRAEQAKIKIHPGQFYTVKFYAENTSDRGLIGQAIPSVAPGTASPLLKKAQCFCFTAQKFEPHQEREMPVRFVVDPSLPADVKDMTLSYTFFDITDKKQDQIQVK